MPLPTRRPRIGFNSGLGREVRFSARRQRLGPDPRCACGATLLPALSRRKGEVTCYRCLLKRETEEDHTHGHQFEDVKQTTDANYHRLLSDLDFGAEARLQQFLDAEEQELMRRLRGG